MFVSPATGVVSTGGLPESDTLPLIVAVVVGEIAAPATPGAVGPQPDQLAGAASFPFTVTFPLTVVLPWVVIAPMKFMFGMSSLKNVP